MRSHGGKSGAGRGSGRGMKTRKRVGRRPGCGAENISAGRGRSAVARKTSRQVEDARLWRGKHLGRSGAEAAFQRCGNHGCRAENLSAELRHSGRRSDGVSVVAGKHLGRSGAEAAFQRCGNHGCRAENLSAELRHSGRSANDTAAGRTLFRRHGKYGGNRHRPGCGKPVGGAPALSEAPVAPPLPVMAATPPR